MSFTTLALSLSFLVTYTSSSIGVKAAKGSIHPTGPDLAPGSVLGENEINFTKCRRERKEVITKAVFYANERIERANRYFQTHSSKKRGNVYTKYFGRSSLEDYNAVLLHFRNMAGRVTLVNYNCQPCARLNDRDAPPTYFLNENSPTVRLCAEFWEQPRNKLRSWLTFGRPKDDDYLTKFQAGRIIHALSQFGDVRGGVVEDFYWDEADATGFARQDPARVARSADNYMYFAKNVPRGRRLKR